MLISLEELPGHSIRLGERGRKEHVRQFLGTSNNPFDQPEAISRSPQCPKIGGQDLIDPTCIIVDVDISRLVSDEPGNLWKITYTSSTEYDDDQNLSPLDLPAAFSWHAEQFERYTEYDVKKRPIVTSAKTLIPVKVEDSRWVISVRKNLPAVPAEISEMNNALNSGAVTVDGVQFAKLTLMCKGIRIGETQRETFKRRRIEYREVSFQLHYRREGWKSRDADADYMEIRDAYFHVQKKDGSYELDKEGNPVRRKGKQRRFIEIGEPKVQVSQPWPLAKDGSALPPDFQPEDVRFIESDVYFPRDFSALPLR